MWPALGRMGARTGGSEARVLTRALSSGSARAPGNSRHADHHAHPAQPQQVHGSAQGPSKHAIGAVKRNNAAEMRVAESLISEVKRYEERHEEKIRQKATPEAMLSLTMLEDELRAEMAVCLGRMDTRLRQKMKVMEELNEQVKQVLAKPYRDVPALLEVVKAFNAAQEEAYTARMELMVQRQSAGFCVENHTLIMARYPIPPKKRVRSS